MRRYSDERQGFYAGLLHVLHGDVRHVQAAERRLEYHFRSASMGAMIRLAAATLIIGVPALLATSSIASEFGLVDDPMTTSTLLSVVSFSTLRPRRRRVRRIVEKNKFEAFGGRRRRDELKCVSLRNSERSAGPVVDKVTPTLTCA